MHAPSARASLSPDAALINTENLWEDFVNKIFFLWKTVSSRVWGAWDGHALSRYNTLSRARPRSIALRTCWLDDKTENLWEYLWIAILVKTRFFREWSGIMWRKCESKCALDACGGSTRLKHQWNYWWFRDGKSSYASSRPCKCPELLVRRYSCSQSGPRVPWCREKESCSS